jgi:hypothetical protein
MSQANAAKVWVVVVMRRAVKKRSFLKVHFCFSTPSLAMRICGLAMRFLLAWGWV